MGRLLFTGDMHGMPNRISARAMEKRGETPLAAGDTVMVAGDAGFLFSRGGTREEDYWLDWLAEREWDLAFADGNHENHDRLDALPREARFGGEVGVLRPNVLHMRRGQVLTVSGRSVFVLGGASSHDRGERVEGYDWWSGELPCGEDYAASLAALDAAGWSVDYVLTHAAPASVIPSLGLAASRDAGRELEDFLDGVALRLSFRRWYFGHYHQDCHVGEGYRFRALYHDVEEAV